MKRFVPFALLAAVLCIGTKAAAQVEADDDDNRPMWGIKASFDMLCKTNNFVENVKYTCILLQKTSWYELHPKSHFITLAE